MCNFAMKNLVLKLYIGPKSFHYIMTEVNCMFAIDQCYNSVTRMTTSSSGNSQPLISGTPPQVPPLPGPSTEKELDACFIRALHLLHSTDPEAKNDLRRLVEQQIELTTASNKPHTAKQGFSLGEAKKQVGTASRFKEKSPQVVTTTTTLVSGGVNTMHMEDTLSPLSAKLSSSKEVFNRLSSSSSNDDTPILPANPRRVTTKPSSPKRMKLTTPRELLGESDDSLDDNSTGNDSFDDNGKELEKSDHPPHPITPPISALTEPTRPIRTAHKTTFLSSVDKLSLPHSKAGHHGVQRGSTLLTHKKHLTGSRPKGKSALNKQLLKKFK